MLRVQKLICKNPIFHKHCIWRGTTLVYQDKDFLLLNKRLQRETAKSGTAYRIVHNRLGLLITIKLGHDDRLVAYYPENITPQALLSLSS